MTAPRIVAVLKFFLINNKQSLLRSIKLFIGYVGELLVTDPTFLKVRVCVCMCVWIALLLLWTQLNAKRTK